VSHNESDQIVLRNSAGRKIGFIALIDLIQNRGHYHVKINKRGNLVHAIRKQRFSLVPLSSDGVHFEQTLDSGRVVHSLRGTPGSGRQQTLVEEMA
jgi:hypothetical protein